MRRAAGPAVALAMALWAPAPARAAAEAAGPEAVDVAAFRDKLVLLSDGKSHLVAVLPMELRRQLDASHALFYAADGKRFYSVPVHSGGQNGESWYYGFNEPRLAEGGHEEGTGDFRFDAPDKYQVMCGPRKTELKPLDKAEGQKVLGAAAFLRSPRKHRPYVLARDSRGRYFYVDHGATKETAKSFRLFSGPKGNLQRQKMTNVVSDSEGDVFSTKTGSLRMVVGRTEVTWIEKNSPQKLTIVPVDFNKNVAMIYNELGVYSGERLGTPCDDL